MLVDKLPKYAVPDVAQYLEYDFTDHTHDERHAKSIVQMLLNSGVKANGCCTFCEECVPLAALICDMLHLNGAGSVGARIAKKKSCTQNTLCDRTACLPHFPQTYRYAERCCHIENDSDLDTAEKSIEFPAIIKFEYGVGGIGAKLVHDIKEAREHLKLCKKDLSGYGLGHDNSMLLMKYIKGTQHNIDIVIYKRKLVVAFVTDFGPTKEDYFTETAECLPSCLPKDKIRQIITAAYQCSTGVGLVTGVFCVEMKMTPTGPKLIEINARMPGYQYRDWIKKVYGVDLVNCVFMTACGIKPLIHKPKPRFQMMGVMCIPSIHAMIFTNTQTKDLLKNLHCKGDIYYFAIHEEFTDVDPATQAPICNIGAIAGDVPKAKEKLLNLCTLFHLITDEYDIRHFLKDFKENIV